MFVNSQQPDLIVSSDKFSGKPHRFSHGAMATIFEIFIIHENARYAEQAAHCAFNEVDRLEQELSRFIGNSDISRVTSLGRSQPVCVGPDAFECLEQCAGYYKQTNKAFDITVGPLIKCWLNNDKTLRNPTDDELLHARNNTGMNHVRLNKKQHTVKLKRDEMCLDLGAFGKGYAVDRIAEFLREWDIEAALIHGGMSSVLAVGTPPGETGWQVTISNPKDYKNVLARFYLHDRALNGSGIQKGQHIINPKTGRPVNDRYAAWAVTPTAAAGDAFSTAFMIMEPEEIRELCVRNKDIQAMLIKAGIDSKDEILRFGEWETVS